MKNDDVSLPSVPAAITTAIDALPEPVQLGALRAFSRLIGGAGAYLAAWMRRPVQGVEDRTDAQSLMTRRLAEAAAEHASKNPELVEAAMLSFLPQHLRKHANKERVVEAAVDELVQGGNDAPTQDKPTGDVDEDWMNLFERFAEEASSDRLQKLWGRVLAGEIKQSGSFSKRTLRFISELDQQTAKRCEVIAAEIIDDFIPARDEFNSGIVFGAGLEAQQMGLLEGFGSLGLQRKFLMSSDGRCIISGRNLGLLLLGSPGKTLPVEVRAVLTSTGKEVFSLLDLGDETARLKSLTPKMQVEGVDVIYLVRLQPEPVGVRYWELEELWRRDVPAGHSHKP